MSHTVGTAPSRKATSYLEALVQTKAISPKGKEWLVAAIDPFHDTDICCSGYPDMNNSASVVQLVKQTMTISCPAAITAGTWDCNIFCPPWPTSQPMAGSIIGDNIISQGVAPICSMGGVTALTAQSGVSTGPFNGAIVNAAVMNMTNCTSLGVPYTYFQGGARVIAQGFEVVNTTSALNQQGQVISYRQPQSFTNGTNYAIADPGFATLIGSGTYRNCQIWPGTPALAMLLPGSRQWHSKEGIYTVSTLNNTNMPCLGLDWTNPIIQNDDVDNAVDTICIVPQIVGVGLAAILESPALMPLSNFNMNGAYFTGLSLQTTLQITYNCYVERFPGSQETDLVVLAQPSPQYDPLALELYSQALHDMPPGVMVKENGLGDWFMDVINKVSGFLSPILATNSNPIAKGVGALLPAVASSMSSFIAPPNTKAPKQRKRRQDVVREVVVQNRPPPPVRRTLPLSAIQARAASNRPPSQRQAGRRRRRRRAGGERLKRF